MRKRIDLTGKKFGRLIVIGFSHIGKNRDSYWIARCVCGGNTKAVSGDSLKRGTSKSCGCLCISLISTHRLSLTPVYMVWKQIKDRCFNPNNKRYKHYGGRGIAICERWMKFENFFEDMGHKPKGLYIDRIDNNKGYYKQNCKWSTPREQANNRSNSRIIKHNGLSLTVAQWARELNIKEQTLRSRLRKQFPIEKVLKQGKHAKRTKMQILQEMTGV